MKNLRFLFGALFIIAGTQYSIAQQDSTKAAPVENPPVAPVEAVPAQDAPPTTNTQPAPEVQAEPKANVTRLKPVWIFGIHGVAIDDDGIFFGDLFAASKSWNFLPYPSRISAERTLNNVWRIEAAIAYSQYKKGRMVNDQLMESTQPFVAVDVNAKYDLNDLFGETSVFDPYTVTGLGFTHRSGIRADKNTPNANLGLGFNVWIYKGWGVCLQTTAKIKLNPKSSNYLMHSAGIVYRLNFIVRPDATNGNGAIRQQL